MKTGSCSTGEEEEYEEEEEEEEIEKEGDKNGRSLPADEGDRDSSSSSRSAPTASPPYAIIDIPSSERLILCPCPPRCWLFYSCRAIVVLPSSHRRRRLELEVMHPVLLPFCMLSLHARGHGKAGEKVGRGLQVDPNNCDEAPAGARSQISPDPRRIATQTRLFTCLSRVNERILI